MSTCVFNLRRARGRLVALATPFACALLLGLATGCPSRNSGQVEIFGVNEEKGTLSRYSEGEANALRGVIPEVGDPVRLNGDVVTIQVETAYLQNLPFALTGSHDVIVFCDVWENAAAGYNTPALTSIVYIGPNEKVPGKLNFRDALAYGPTTFKGHPMRIRFTVMVLQKDQAKKEASAVDVIGAFASAAAPQYAPLTGTIANTIQGILKAQPDIKFFDFEATLLSDQPEGLANPIVDPRAVGSAQGGTTQRATDIPEPPALQSVARPADKVQWFRYGRFALVETASHDGTAVVPGIENPANIVCRDGNLRYGDGTPVQSSYMIVRVLPHQKTEQSDVLLAASQANTRLIQSLSQSETDIGKALGDIKASTAALSEQVLRSKAEGLASDIATEAETASRRKQMKPGPVVVDVAKVRVAGLAALKTQFPPSWEKIVQQAGPDLKAKATEIGDGVLLRWRHKYGDYDDATTTKPASPAAGFAPQQLDDLRDRLLEDTNKQVTAGPLTFTITSAEIVKGAGADAPDTLKVELAPPANPGANKVKLKDLQDAIVAHAGSVAKGINDKAENPIKKAEIKNQNQDPLKSLIQP